MSWNYGDDPKPQLWPHDQGYMSDKEAEMRAVAGPDYDIRQGTILTVEGIKHDQDKPDLSLVPGEFSAEVARGFMHGASKYGRYNYLNGMDWHRVIAAVKRHVDAFQEGEDKDPESGVSHLAHASCGLAMLLVFQKRGLGKDTRYKK